MNNDAAHRNFSFFQSHLRLGPHEAHKDAVRMEEIAAEFGEGKSLYDVLEIPSTASSPEVKKAYFKIALKCHPDKCPGDPSAKARFQALSMVHSVLSDPERRALYDETGEVAEEDGVTKSSEDTWYEYWRTLFPRITVADIESFSSKYQGSDEEREDVIDAYKKCQGKMSDIIDSVILASEADVDRFREIIELAIGREDVPDFAIFRKERKAGGSFKSKGKRRAKEATEAEELATMLKQRHRDRMETALATHREKQFNNMVSSLEERYGGKKARGSRRKRTNKGVEESKETQDMPEIDDDEFQRIQQKMLKERSKR